MKSIIKLALPFVLLSVQITSAEDTLPCHLEYLLCPEYFNNENNGDTLIEKIEQCSDCLDDSHLYLNIEKLQLFEQLNAKKLKIYTKQDLSELLNDMNNGFKEHRAIDDQMFCKKNSGFVIGFAAGSAITGTMGFLLAISSYRLYENENSNIFEQFLGVMGTMISIPLFSASIAFGATSTGLHFRYKKRQDLEIEYINHLQCIAPVSK